MRYRQTLKAWKRRYYEVDFLIGFRTFYVVQVWNRCHRRGDLLHETMIHYGTHFWNELRGEGGKAYEDF